MTQTIKNCNEIPQGKTYPVEHLRAAESIEQLFELVDNGHPIATDFGIAIALLRRESDILFNCDILGLDGISVMAIKQSQLLTNVKLAPLAYRNGRPLHIGDEVEWKNMLGQWVYKKKIGVGFLGHQKKLTEYQWRFADEVDV